MSSRNVFYIYYLRDLSSILDSKINQYSTKTYTSLFINTTLVDSASSLSTKRLNFFPKTELRTMFLSELSQMRLTNKTLRTYRIFYTLKTTIDWISASIVDLCLIWIGIFNLRIPNLFHLTKIEPQSLLSIQKVHNYMIE